VCAPENEKRIVAIQPRNSCGSLAKFAAIRHASSLVSSLAAERRAPAPPRSKGIDLAAAASGKRAARS
jgi:hypothetical protein